MTPVTRALYVSPNWAWSFAPEQQPVGELAIGTDGVGQHPSALPVESHQGRGGRVTKQADVVDDPRLRRGRVLASDHERAGIRIAVRPQQLTRDVEGLQGADAVEVRDGERVRIGYAEQVPQPLGGEHVRGREVGDGVRVHEVTDRGSDPGRRTQQSPGGCTHQVEHVGPRRPAHPVQADAPEHPDLMRPQVQALRGLFHADQGTRDICDDALQRRGMVEHLPPGYLRRHSMTTAVCVAPSPTEVSR